MIKIATIEDEENIRQEIVRYIKKGIGSIEGVEVDVYESAERYLLVGGRYEADIQESKKKCEEMAEKFAITDLLDKKPYELSGGEKQRTAICRALIYNPDLILADEPTGNLDSASSEVVIHTLEEINKKMGKTILLVTHDPIIASSCDRIIFLKDGKVKEDLKRTGDKEQFYNEIITNWC